MSKGVCLYYISRSVILYTGSFGEIKRAVRIAGGRLVAFMFWATNPMPSLFTIFDRTNKVHQCSFGATNSIRVPGGSPPAGEIVWVIVSAVEQDLPAGESITLTEPNVPTASSCCGSLVTRGVCPSTYWCMLLIPINDAATKSTIIDTEVLPNMPLRLLCSIKRYNDWNDRPSRLTRK